MDKEQVMGLIFLIGSLLGFLALVLSLAWHRLDAYLIKIEPQQGERFDDVDARWGRIARIREWVRIVGLVCLYVSLFALGVGAAGLGVTMLEGKA